MKRANKMILQVIFVLNLLIIKSLSQCDTEASSASECFQLGCCWNGFNSSILLINPIIYP